MFEMPELWTSGKIFSDAFRHPIRASLPESKETMIGGSSRALAYLAGRSKTSR